MNKELESEGEKYAELFRFKVEAEKSWFQTKKEDFIAGATSKWVEKQKLKFTIEQLNKLDSVLQSKIEMLNRLLDDSKDSDNREYFRTKISGVRLAKEEIRRDIKELEQKLSEL